jgi:CAAX prenyl protease-like protein
MFVFIALLALAGLLHKIDNYLWLTRCEYWIYPLQTIVCGLLLIRFWPEYDLRRPRRASVGIIIGGAVFLLWISPQMFLRFPARIEGFDPNFFAGQPALYLGTVIFRFLRLVVVVPLVEEIFWRGFLLRYLIDENFDRVTFGTFSWLSFAVVTLAFGFSHSQADWIAAILTGIFYNGVAYWSKSLSTCVLTHALTNLLLGLWIMRTQQWGFW